MEENKEILSAPELEALDIIQKKGSATVTKDSDEFKVFESLANKALIRRAIALDHPTSEFVSYLKK